MKLISGLLVSLLALPAVLAAGEDCNYYDGSKYGNVDGECGNPSTCINTYKGYWVANQCPGGNNNRCCIRRTCTTASGILGVCTTTANCDRLGARRVANRCPGPTNVQCCY